MLFKIVLVCFCICLFAINEGNCLNKRCIKCRSRGELGSCGDPLPFNVTDPEAEYGIHVVACPSGWCGKIIEGTTGAFRTDDYGTATERMCFQRPPSDDEERCASTTWNHKKVFICFCNGDLCNAASKLTKLSAGFIFVILVMTFNWFYQGGVI